MSSVNGLELVGLKASSLKLERADANRLVQTASWIHTFSSHPVKPRSKCPFGSDYDGMQARSAHEPGQQRDFWVSVDSLYSRDV